MEMESMEEGYLAQILIKEGTEGIPVGKVRPLECLNRPALLLVATLRLSTADKAPGNSRVAISSLKPPPHLACSAVALAPYHQPVAVMVEDESLIPKFANFTADAGAAAAPPKASEPARAVTERCAPGCASTSPPCACGRRAAGCALQRCLAPLRCPSRRVRQRLQPQLKTALSRVPKSLPTNIPF